MAKTKKQSVKSGGAKTVGQKLIKKAATKPTAKPTAKSVKKPVKKKASGPKKPPAPPFLSTGFWLLKSEPESYSIDQLAHDKQTLWTGVRNYQARNFMMTSMKPGDEFLFYHSSAEPTAVVGTGKILRTNLADPTALDPKSDYHDSKASHDHPIWFCAEVAFTGKLKTPVTLDEIRKTPELKNMPLLAPGQRLSIQPVAKAEFELILKIAGAL